GVSVYLQGKKNGKSGVTITYNYSRYKYPSDITQIDNLGTGYVAQRPESPPYVRELGENTTSTINGFSVELFRNFRIKTYSKSNTDLKISAGFGNFTDLYRTSIFGEKKTGTYSFNSLMCNMYVTHLIWVKNLGIEPLLGIAYYYPLLKNNYYLSSNPFIAAELEAGISFYYKKNKKHHR
ncbi:MAG: hypothetical protein O9353_12135, partial [Bacteroidia bacterium]|nr:hypothetical protein [Bacteroidia bacterium]